MPTRWHRLVGLDHLSMDTHASSGTRRSSTQDVRSAGPWRLLRAGFGYLQEYPSAGDRCGVPPRGVSVRLVTFHAPFRARGPRIALFCLGGATAAHRPSAAFARPRGLDDLETARPTRQSGHGSSQEFMRTAFKERDPHFPRGFQSGDSTSMVASSGARRRLSSASTDW